MMKKYHNLQQDKVKTTGKERERTKQQNHDQRIAAAQAKLDLKNNQEIHHNRVRESVRDCLEATKGINLYDGPIPRGPNGEVEFAYLDMGTSKFRRTKSL